MDKTYNYINTYSGHGVHLYKSMPLGCELFFKGMEQTPVRLRRASATGSTSSHVQHSV